MGDLLKPNEDPAANPVVEPPKPPTHLPEDHPLVTALGAQKAKNADLQARLDAIAAEQMSDLEKAQKATEDAIAAAAAKDADIAKAHADALRWRTAAKHGISDEDAELFLTGADEETLTKQAERLAARAIPPKGISIPGVGQEPGDPPPLDAQIRAAEAKGDTSTVMALKSQMLADLAQQQH